MRRRRWRKDHVVNKPELIHGQQLINTFTFTTTEYQKRKRWFTNYFIPPHWFNSICFIVPFRRKMRTESDSMIETLEKNKLNATFIPILIFAEMEETSRTLLGFPWKAIFEHIYMVLRHSRQGGYGYGVWSMDTK